MKTKTFLAVALAAMTLASCNKEEGADVAATDAVKKSLIVALPGASVGTYAVEDPQAAGQITPLYSDAVVYLFDAGDNATCYAFDDEDLAAKSIKIEEVVKPVKVMVIVNKGNAVLPTTGTTTQSAITTALEALTVEMQNKAVANLTAADTKGNAAGDYISVQQVTLKGETATLEDIPNWDGHDAWKADVQLKSLVSRFEIGTVKKGTGLESLIVTDVYVNYFYRTNKKDASTSLGEANWNDSTIPAELKNAGSTEVTSVASTKCYAYQVFAGDMVPHIIFKVSGTVSDGYKLADGTTGVFSDRYITVTGFKESGIDITEIEAHKIYKVGLENGGIEITPEEITPDPELTKYDLQVNITVADWTVTTVTPNI